jgi:hypothetical protein
MCSPGLIAGTTMCGTHTVMTFGVQLLVARRQGHRSASRPARGLRAAVMLGLAVAAWFASAGRLHCAEAGQRGSPTSGPHSLRIGPNGEESDNSEIPQAALNAYCRCYAARLADAASDSELRSYFAGSGGMGPGLNDKSAVAMKQCVLMIDIR